MQNQLELFEELERQHEAARIRLISTRQELNCLVKVMNLLENHINENLQVQKRSSAIKDDERRMAIVRESFDKLRSKYERFKEAKIERENDLKKLMTEKVQLEVNLNSMKTQISSLKKLHSSPTATNNSLDGNQTTTDRKQNPAFDYDVETINILNECNWNLAESCDRTLAETLLGCFPSGTFLVRSSRTKPNSFALSVVANSKVRHCLIDKVDEEYCFHPHGPQRQTYPSLCALVMDYRHKSLIKHNTELDTNLVYPVLSQLKKTSKGNV